MAIKTYDKFRIINPEKRLCVRSKVHILRLIGHPNVVKLFDVIETAHQVHLVQELVAGSSLKSYLKAKFNNKLDEAEARGVFLQMAKAISYCHKLNITHRNIKLENAILDRNRTLK